MRKEPVTDTKKLALPKKTTRISKHMKQCVLTKAIGMTPNHMSLIGAGERTPSLKTLFTIAKLLETKMADLFYGISFD